MPFAAAHEPVQARNGHAVAVALCPFLGVKRASFRDVERSAYDPNRTSASADAIRGQAGAEVGLAMDDQHHWQLDGSAPELYEKYLVPAITTKWADDLVGRAQPSAGETVLDVACGTGVVARSASRRMRHGHVTGLDLNKGMLAVAQTVVSEGARIDLIEGSALDLPFPAGKFDLALCQLGLQFFPDRGRALREMRRVLLPSGRVALSVYSPIERTPGANAFVLALDRVLGPNASKIKRGEHSFNASAELRELIIEAGFAKVEVQTVAQQIAFPSVLDHVIPTRRHAYGGAIEYPRRC